MLRYSHVAWAVVLACIAVGCGGDDSQVQSPGLDAGKDGANVVPQDGGKGEGGSGIDAGKDGGGADADRDGGSSMDGSAADSGGVDASGDGGVSEGGTVAKGHGASAMVSAGAVSRSPDYTLTGTLGQSPGGNNTSSSRSYKLRGGVVGATQAP